MNKMRLRFGLLLVACFVMATWAGFGVAYAAGPQGLIAYYPVNIVNTQSAATSGNFQMQFNGLPFNAMAGNWIFANTISNSALACWAENKGTIWCNMGTNTIGAGKSVNGIYVFYIGSSSQNFFLGPIGSNDVGASPNATATYGQYDNGNSVFIDYNNFYGISLPSGWTEPSCSGGGVLVVNNGLRLNGGSGNCEIQSGNLENPQADINDWYGTITAVAGAGQVVWGGWYSGTAGNLYGVGSIGAVSGYNAVIEAAGSGKTNGISLGIGFSTTNYILSSYGTSFSYNAFYNYGSNYGSTTNYASFISLPEGFEATGNAQLNAAWSRVRIQPPNLIMPIVTYGSFANPSASINLPSSVTYGSSFTVTGTCTTGDTCSVYSTNTNIQECTGTSTCSYSTLTTLSANSYGFNAIDSMGPISSGTGILTVSPASITATCTQNSNMVTNGITYLSIVTNSLIQCSFPSYNGQITGSLYFSGTQQSTGTNTPFYNAAYNNANNLVVANELGNQNYTANSITFWIDFVPYQFISATGNSGKQYETSVQTFTYVISLNNAYQTANVAFTANSANVLWNNQTITGSPQTFIFNYPVPLLATNAMPYTFNAVLYLNSPFTNEGVQNTITQTELFNYFPNANSIPVNILLGGNETIQFGISQVQALSAANVVAADVQIGASANTLLDTKVSQYLYNAIAYSFVPSYYGLATPSIGNPIQINGNQVIKLGFNNANVFRNVTFTPFNAFQEAVVNCYGAGNTLGITWNFYNVPSLVQDTTANVLLQGALTVSLNNYVGNTVNGTSAGLPNTANAMTAGTSFTTCIYPTWGNFYIGGVFQYNTTNSIVSTFYYVNQNINSGVSSLQPQKLYLSTLTNPSSYNIYAVNQSTQQPVATVVQVLQFIPNTGKSVLINSFKTSPYSPGTTYLQIGTNYTLNAYSPTSGAFLGGVTFTAVSCSPSACTQTIPIGKANNNFIPSQIKDLSTSCTNTPQGGNVMLTSCAFHSVSGSSYVFNLTIIAGNSTQTCFNTVTTSSGSLSCTSIHINNMSYTWTLATTTNGGVYVELQLGTFGTSSFLFGTDGGIAAFIITAACALGFGWFSKKASMFLVGAGIGLAGSSFMMFVSLGTGAIGGMLIMLGIAIFVVERVKQG